MRAALERHGILVAYRLTEGTIHRCELRRALHRMLTVVCVCVTASTYRALLDADRYYFGGFDPKASDNKCAASQSFISP